jgi:carbonic anhydrase/acetyltransferase-like protein (isoleucine patch superfamily)
MPLYALNDMTPTVPDEDTFWIAPDAHVIGDVTLGREVGIWFGAVIRGDNAPIRIGEGTNIQEGVMIHVDPGCPVTIGAGCTIGHHAIIHGCTIGENTLIGMGATILNNARIGKNCLIGANALITEGRDFPDGSLIVGAPAKAIRMLDEATILSLSASAQTYQANWKRFKNGLRPL